MLGTRSGTPSRSTAEVTAVSRARAAAAWPGALVSSAFTAAQTARELLEWAAARVSPEQQRERQQLDAQLGALERQRQQTHETLMQSQRRAAFDALYARNYAHPFERAVVQKMGRTRAVSAQLEDALALRALGLQQAGEPRRQSRDFGVDLGDRAPADREPAADVLARVERMRLNPVRRQTNRMRGEHLSSKGGSSTEFADPFNTQAGFTPAGSFGFAVTFPTPAPSTRPARIPIATCSVTSAPL